MSKRRKSKLGLIVILGIGVYFVFLLVKQQFLLDAKAAELQDVQNKITAETKINEDLKKEKENVHSNEFIEKIAREQLGMIKHNEKVFVDIGK